MLYTQIDSFTSKIFGQHLNTRKTKNFKNFKKSVELKIQGILESLVNEIERNRA